jgi:hypothetical protein
MDDRLGRHDALQYGRDHRRLQALGDQGDEPKARREARADEVLTNLILSVQEFSAVLGSLPSLR